VAAAEGAPSPKAPLMSSAPFGIWGLRFEGERSRLLGVQFRIQGSGFRVQGSRFRVQGLGLKVQGPP
jgi:hypothetical protein